MTYNKKYNSDCDVEEVDEPLASIETVYDEVSSLKHNLDKLIFKKNIEFTDFKNEFISYEEIPIDGDSLIYNLTDHQLFEDLSLNKMTCSHGKQTVSCVLHLGSNK